MKLKLPNFNFDFSDFDVKRPLDDLWEDSTIYTTFRADGAFPFNATITADYWRGDGYFVYGYISTSRHYDDSFVRSGDIVVKTTREFIAAYKKIEKELKTKYRAWVKEQLYTK